MPHAQGLSLFHLPWKVVHSHLLLEEVADVVEDREDLSLHYGIGVYAARLCKSRPKLMRIRII